MSRNSGDIGARALTLCALAFTACLLSGQALAQTKPTPNWGATDIQVNPQTQPNFRKNTPEVIPNSQFSLGAAAIEAKYKEIGGTSNYIGAPVGESKPTPNGGQFRLYQQGFIFWNRLAGAGVSGPYMLSIWKLHGFEKGPLGFPTSFEFAVGDGGRRNNFQNGVIVMHPMTQAYAIYGRIGARWIAQAAGNKLCGYPLGDETDGPLVQGGRTRLQHFQYGTIRWVSATDKVDMTCRGK